MINLQLPSHARGILGKPSVRGCWKKLPDMISNMKECVKALYEDSAFKHFLRVPPLKGDGIIIHMMLLHQIHTETKDCLHFKIGDNTLTYGPLEFCMISGLRFSSYPRYLKDKRKWLGIPQKQSQFSSRVFPDVEKGKLTNEILERVVLGAELAGLSDTDALRACLLSTLVCCGYIGNGKNETIGEDLFVMLCLGSDLYEHSLLQLSSVYGKIDKELKKEDDRGRTIKYSLSGFTLPFQVWIWESLRFMHKRFITRACDMMPRMSRWSTSVHVRWPDVFEIFEESKTNVGMFVLEEREKNEQYYRDFCDHMGLERARVTDVGEQLRNVTELVTETRGMVCGLLNREQQNRGTDILEDFFDVPIMQAPINVARNDSEGPGNVDLSEHNTDSVLYFLCEFQ